MNRVLTIASLVLAAGCSAGVVPEGAPPPPMSPVDVSATSAGAGSANFILRMPGESDVDVLVGDRSITGPGVSIARYDGASDHAIRGEAFGRTVNVDITADDAKGLVGAAPFDVHVALVGDEIKVHGLVYGKPTMLAFNPRGLSGNVGRCMFQLARQGSEYVGTRGCSRGVQAASMSFPASFGRWSRTDLGAALAILLSSGS